MHRSLSITKRSTGTTPGESLRGVSLEGNDLRAGFGGSDSSAESCWMSWSLFDEHVAREEGLSKGPGVGGSDVSRVTWPVIGA